MLRVELSEDDHPRHASGAVVGMFVTETEALVALCNIPGRLILDVSEVTFVHAIGEQVLSGRR